MSFLNKKKIIWAGLMLIGILIIAGVILAIKNWQINSSEDGLQAGCVEPRYSATINYNSIGSLDFISEEPTAPVIEIGKHKKLYSLGKFKVNLDPNTIVKISKLWLTFFSDELSKRSDKLYPLEKSYVSKIILKSNGRSKEIDLGNGDEYAFLELPDCPLGNIKPVDKASSLDFEVLLEVGCNNIVDGQCLDNNGRSLDYLDGMPLSARFRFFVSSFEDFTKDVTVSTSFGYK